VERETVLAAIGALPLRHQEIVGLRYLLGLSEAETAATLGVPLGTVKSRTARALDRLETSLSTSLRGPDD
jgi:RNA polymerase sigma-70 factor (ECF subfamily)